jgi:GNAT superfamily N-acetyltransferase
MEQTDFHYPVQWIDRWPLPDGQAITVRPVLPQDEALQLDFFSHQLGNRSRYQRFQISMQALPGSAAQYFTRIDYRDHFALIAETFGAQGQQQIGDARYVRIADAAATAEFALAIADRWQGQGWGRRLLELLLAAAQAHGIHVMQGDVLRDNSAMLRLVQTLGFTLKHHPDDGRLLRVVRTLAIAHPTTPANDTRWDTPPRPLEMACAV